MTDQHARDPHGEVAEAVVETWTEATPGKDPSVTPGDFERMREGFEELADAPGEPDAPADPPRR